MGKECLVVWSTTVTWTCSSKCLAPVSDTSSEMETNRTKVAQGTQRNLLDPPSAQAGHLAPIRKDNLFHYALGHAHPKDNAPSLGLQSKCGCNNRHNILNHKFGRRKNFLCVCVCVCARILTLFLRSVCFFFAAKQSSTYSYLFERAQCM